MDMQPAAYSTLDLATTHPEGAAPGRSSRVEPDDLALQDGAPDEADPVDPPAVDPLKASLNGCLPGEPDGLHGDDHTFETAAPVVAAGSDPDDQLPSARLPGEPDSSLRVGLAAASAAPEASERLQTSGIPRSQRRRWLLLGGAVAALAAAGLGGVLAFSAQVEPAPRMASTMRQLAVAATPEAAPPLAPSASVANVNLPPSTPPATRGPYTRKPPQAQVQELLSLQANPQTGSRDGVQPENSALSSSEAPPLSNRQNNGGSEERGAAAAPRRQPAAAAAAETGGHGTPAEEPTGSTGNQPAPARAAAAVAAPAAPSQGAAATEPPQAPAPAPARDAIVVAASLHAAPMTQADQVQVLDLVTEMATMMRDLRQQNAQLRSDLQKSAADTATQLADFGRRLALADARSAVSSAHTVAEPAPASPATASPPPARTAPIVLTRTEPAAPAAGPAAPRRFRVQAASPSLALLAEIDRGGGEGAQLQVTVGDVIPGYGRIKSIGQKGTSWVVTTEQGTIQ